MGDAAGRILAVDPGEARIGLAVCDGLGLSVRPLKVLRGSGPARDADAIAAVAVEQQVTRVVVGLALLSSGEEGAAARGARRLAARLRGRLRDVTVELWDERLTTVEAERMLREMGVGERRRRRSVDGLSAVLILLSYLDSRSSSESSP